MAHAFIPVPNCARVELIYSLNGVVAENVFNVQKGSPFTLAQLQALRTTVDGWDSAHWNTARSTLTSLQRIRTKALDSAVAPTEDYFLPAPRFGSVSSFPMPGNTTLAIKLVTGLAGRSFRGRWYWAGICVAHMGATYNQILPSTVTAVVSLLNLLLTTLAGAGYTLGVVSYRTGHAYRAVGVFTPAIGYTATDNNVDSMSRRLTAHGP